MRRFKTGIIMRGPKKLPKVSKTSTFNVQEGKQTTNSNNYIHTRNYYVQVVAKSKGQLKNRLHSLHTK